MNVIRRTSVLIVLALVVAPAAAQHGHEHGHGKDAKALHGHLHEKLHEHVQKIVDRAVKKALREHLHARLRHGVGQEPAAPKRSRKKVAPRVTRSVTEARAHHLRELKKALAEARRHLEVLERLSKPHSHAHGLHR